MNRLMGLCICTVVFMLNTAVGPELYAQAETKHHRYQIVDLGPAGGPNSAISTQAVAVNRHGRVVGGADTGLHDPYDPNCFSDCFVTLAYSWKHGSATDLGALSDGVSSTAIAVNDFGLIDGVSENGEIDPQTGFPEVIAVAWLDGNIISLGTLGGTQSATSGTVSNRGEIVGGALNEIADPFANDFSQFFMFVPATTQCHAFLWHRGNMRDLGTLGGPDSIASSVNDRGQVSGQSYTNSIPNPVTKFPTLDPFFWEDGQMIDLGTLGGNFGVADWMNDRGQVVGGSDLKGDTTGHPYLSDQGGQMQDLGTLGGDNGEAFSINDAGVVVGRADLPGSGAHHAFLWKRGHKMEDLGVPQGDTCSTALSVNIHNQVVGDSGVCGVGGHAFLWENGGPMVSLQRLVIPGSELQVTDADFINDRGEIACIGTVADGNSHACLLIPTDELVESNANTIVTIPDASEMPRAHTVVSHSPLRGRSAPKD